MFLHATKFSCIIVSRARWVHEYFFFTITCPIVARYYKQKNFRNYPLFSSQIFVVCVLISVFVNLIFNVYFEIIIKYSRPFYFHFNYVTLRLFIFTFHLILYTLYLVIRSIEFTNKKQTSLFAPIPTHCVWSYRIVSKYRNSLNTRNRTLHWIFTFVNFGPILV